jgi:glycosyltransferase involved in cell wall biosynthesis
MRAAYVSFDRFPSTKGSAVHIRHMAGELFDRYGGGLLCVLGGGDLPRYQREGDVTIHRFDDLVPNLIDRAEAFSGWVADRLAPHRSTLEVCHVRDPWSAVPAIRATDAKLIYEVNGLPSIELPHTWPKVAPSTLAKLRDLERYCLDHAAAVVVPSRVIAKAVEERGARHIHVVPNGADVPAETPPKPAEAPDRYLVYVGALQPWQGVDVLLRAFTRLQDLDDLTLVICSSVPARRARPLRRLADRLGLADRVVWRYTVPHAEVAGWLAYAAVSVAPLTASPRNIQQGCSPLKVWESMAAGVPVVASDMPAVRELITDGEHGRLVPPDRPAELARAVRIVLEYPQVAREQADHARRRIADHFTWADTRARLATVYDQALGLGHRTDS